CPGWGTRSDRLAFFERRESLRVRPTTREVIEVQLVAPGLLEIVHAVDISENGIGVLIDAGVGGDLVGNEVELIITLPGGSPIFTRGSVRRARHEHGLVLGIEFISPNGKALDAIRGYVQRRATQSAGKVRVGG